MAYRKLEFAPGVNRENTPYGAEGAWYDTDKVRFRDSTPEKIGGWVAVSDSEFLGVCRGLHNWSTLGGQEYVAVGTHIKYYVERGGAYTDITPVRDTESLTDPFDTTNGSSTVTVTDTSHGAADGSYVTFSGATAVGGLTLDGEYLVTLVDGDSYTVDAGSNASSTANGGGSVDAAYQINPGYADVVPILGWGAGPYGAGPYGIGESTDSEIRIWSQSNFGEDLVFTTPGHPIYYWDSSAGGRAVALADLGGAASTPAAVNIVHVSDISRFVMAFGSQPFAGGDLDRMLIRWSDQEDPADWAPSATNQAGEIPLSNGSRIVAVRQARQEILVWTDTALYSMQYLGAPDVWGAQLLGANTSIVSQRAAVFVNGVAYWMGRDQFYRYDGTIITLPCTVQDFVFSGLCQERYDQIFAGTNKQFGEVWWFYCSNGTSGNDRYVIHNYLENTWAVGSMDRSAWLDARLRDYPIAATFGGQLMYHENGLDDGTTNPPSAIAAYAETAEFGMDDADKIVLVRKLLPDITFRNSTADTPSVTMTFTPLDNSGSGYADPASVGGVNTGAVSRAVALPVEEYTTQLFLRLRGRQMRMRVESADVGVAWKLGTSRLDARPSGRRGGR